MHANINDDLIFTDAKSGQIIYNLINKQRLFQKPKKGNILNTMSEMKNQTIANNVRPIAMPKTAFEIWKELGRSFQIFVDAFQ